MGAGACLVLSETSIVRNVNSQSKIRNLSAERLFSRAVGIAYAIWKTSFFVLVPFILG